MPLLPNTSAAADPRQATPDSADFEILLEGPRQTGVMTGCGVTANTPAGMSVIVASGNGKYRGRLFALTGSTLTVPAADSSNPRSDLVIVTVTGSTGVATVLPGLATSPFVYPALPANAFPLAALDVPAGAPSVPSTRIVDKRVIIPANRTVNVRDYGATGDGSTDDTVAIQAAFDAVDAFGGGQVLLPNGTYIVTQVKHGSHFTLTGESWGAILKLKAATNLAPLMNKGFTLPASGAGNTNVLMQNFAVDGNRAAQLTGANDPSSSGILQGFVARGTYKNLYIHDNHKLQAGYNGGESLDLFRCTDTIVSGLWTENAGYDGLKTHGCQRGTATNCVFRNSGRSGVQLGGTWDSEYKAGPPGVPGSSGTWVQPTEDWTITNCVTLHTTGLAWNPAYVTSGYYSHGGRRNVFVGNIAYGVQNGCGIWGANDGGDASSNLFANNLLWIRGTTATGWTWSWLHAKINTPAGTETASNNNMFVNNHCFAIDGASKLGIDVSHGTGHYIGGNTFYRSGGSGTWTMSSSTNNTHWVNNRHDGNFSPSVTGTGSSQSWTSFDGNWGFGAQSYGGAVGAISLGNATTVPGSNPTNAAVFYTQAGAPKVRTAGGVVHQLTPLKGTLTTTLPSIDPIHSAVATVTVTGAAVGDVAVVGMTTAGGNTVVSGECLTNAVRVVVYNADPDITVGGGTVTFYVQVWKQG